MDIFGGRFSAYHICRYSTALSCKRNDLKFYGPRAIPLAELAFSLGKRDFPWNILLTAPLPGSQTSSREGSHSRQLLFPVVGPRWVCGLRRAGNSLKKGHLSCLFLSQTWRYLFVVAAFE